MIPSAPILFHDATRAGRRRPSRARSPHPLAPASALRALSAGLHDVPNNGRAAHVVIPSVALAPPRSVKSPMGIDEHGLVQPAS
jgi:hypothetical protein